MGGDFFNLECMTRLALIATGGTIACTTVADGSLVPTISGADLAAEIDAEVVEFRQLDSSSITLADLDELIAVVNSQTSREDIDGVIITHGTDSMVQTGKVTNYPIVLMGTEYWSGLLEWMDKTLAASGYINEGDRELFLLTDDPDEALSHIIQRHQVMSDKRIREPR